MSRLMSDLSPGTYVVNPDTPSSIPETPVPEPSLGSGTAYAAAAAGLGTKQESSTTATVAGPRGVVHSTRRSTRRDQDVGQSEAPCRAAREGRLPLGVHGAERFRA